MVRMLLGVAVVALVAAVAAHPSHGWRNPYVGEGAASFWDDIQSLHHAMARARTPHFHGASRPFFEAITNAFSEGEKAAFERLSQGMLPDGGGGMDVADDVPKNLPLMMKPCEDTEMDGTTNLLMQMESMKVTLDPKHIKAKVGLKARIQNALSSNLTHHTVVSVNGMSMAGFEMSPMVLFDKTGTVCDLFDNVLGCPMPEGELDLQRKVKIPGLDAVTSMPKRLYDVETKIYDHDAMVTCMHFFLDLRPEDERVSNPPPGVTDYVVYDAKVNTIALKPIPQTAAPTQTDASQRSSAPPPSPAGPPPSSSSNGNANGTPQDGGAAPLEIFRSMINLQKSNAATKDKSVGSVTDAERQQEDALLQQLQLKNLQEQLKRQEEINRKQQAEYEKLKTKLTELPTSEVDKLKQTVNELLAVQRAKTDEQKREEEHVRRERELYQQLQGMYKSYNLPATGMTFGDPSAMMRPPPFGASMGMMPFAPQFPFAQPTAVSAAAQQPVAASNVDQARSSQARLPDLQFLSQLDKALRVPIEEANTNPHHSSDDGSAREEMSLSQQAVAITSPPVAEGVQELAQQVIPGQPNPSHVAGEHAADSNPLQYPNPTNPELDYGAGMGGDPNRVFNLAGQEPVEVQEPLETPVPQPTPEGSPEPEPEAPEWSQDSDLPDVSQLLASQAKYVNSNYGVSYVMDSLDDWIESLCVPFVTLASDLSFAFCMPESWQGQLAIVVTEPMTAEKGFFAEKTSVTSPFQNKTFNTTEDQYYVLPTYKGLNELLVKHNYATIVVTFNPDTFVPNTPYFTTEIMGAYAAFVDFAGEPSMTVVSGVGWGGVLATQLLERHGGCRLHGGLILDSPIGSARWQGDYYGDILALFEWVSPRAHAAIMSTRYGAISHLLLESWEEVGRPFVYQALTPHMDLNDPMTNWTFPRDFKMLEMLRSLSVKCSYAPKEDSYDHPHPQCLHDELTDAIRKAAIYVLSYRLAFNGQDPYDNYRTLYVPEVFPRLNEEVSRKMADEAPLNHQSRYFETSGMLRVPLLLLTTRRDPEVPEWQAVEYMRKQKQVCEGSGIGRRVVNDTIDRYFGHAHTDATGKELSEQLDVLYTMVRNARITDDTSLSQRSWVGAPFKMVDPDLAACPPQGEWLRDMLTSLKRSVKSGTLRSSNKINAMLAGQDAIPDQSPTTPLQSAVTSDTATLGAAAGAEAMGSATDAGAAIGDGVGNMAGGGAGAAAGGAQTASLAGASTANAAASAVPVGLVQKRPEVDDATANALTPGGVPTIS